MIFVPRNIGCNRTPIYDDSGKWIRDEVNPSTKFINFSEIQEKFFKLSKNFHLVVQNGIVKHGGIVCGWVKYDDCVSDTIKEIDFQWP